MKKVVSCGFILECASGILICHPTHGGKRWDFPKGKVEPGETDFDAALREVYEETSIVVVVTEDNVIDLGSHKYLPEKDLHLYYVYVDGLEHDVNYMDCSTTFIDHMGQEVKEIDGYKLVRRDTLTQHLGRNMAKWINDHFLTEEVQSKCQTLAKG